MVCCFFSIEELKKNSDSLVIIHNDKLLSISNNQKNITFENALLSPISLAILSGAGLFKGTAEELVHVHQTATAYVGDDGIIDLTDALGANDEIDATAPVFAVVAEEDGSLTGEVITGLAVTDKVKLTGSSVKGKAVFVDFYITKKSANVSELQIDAANFAGYYYVEASTLFRRQNDGVDMPAEITLPNVKIQSNFTFSMASTGDPSTFTFTMDAFPDYTRFDKTKKVLAAIQIVGTTENEVELSRDKTKSNRVEDANGMIVNKKQTTITPQQ